MRLHLQLVGGAFAWRQTPAPSISRAMNCLRLPLAAALVASAFVARNTRAASAAPLHPTLDHTIMAGYQGWYRTPNDGNGLGWFHYGGTTSATFGPKSLSIDYW